jgi:hypothetical protein
MTDITMCSGNNCELSSTCYRYKAEPSEYNQSYFCKPPNNGIECEYYWEIKTKCYCGHTTYCDCIPKTDEEWNQFINLIMAEVLCSAIYVEL